MEKEKLLYSVIILLNLLLVADDASAFEVVSKQSNNAQYQELVKENETRFKAERDGYKAVVERAKEAMEVHSTKINAQAGSIIEQVITNYKAGGTSDTQGLIVFVSFAMPQEMLWSYFEQAKLYGGRMVIRGLVDNSFQKTIQAMNLGENKKLIIDVNPKIFKEFNISRVPAIVQSSKKGHDRIVGSVSIKHALEEIRDKGDTKEESVQRLERVKK
jgi:conjugal transfer pilus assembly protein TrbC